MSTALVTGATAGIGAAFVRALAARGDDLVLVARDADRLDALAAEIRDAHGVAVETLSADLADRGDVDRVAARLENGERPIDLLVNNAGFGDTGSLLAADTSEHDRALEVMCRAPLVLAAAAGRAMKARRRGSIVNVSSLSAWLTQGNYSAVKAYNKVWSEALAGELRGTGVTVTTLCPGWVRTEFHERAGIRTSFIPPFIWVDADRMVQDCLADVAAGKTISIPTRRWKWGALALDLAPRPVIRLISRALGSTRN